jgi:triphosphatase
MTQGGTEIELKFLATEAVFKAARQCGLFGGDSPRPAAQRLRSVYFDTEDGSLRRNNMALRMRTQRRGYILALKWNNSELGAPFERGEIEVKAPSPELDPGLLGAGIAETIANLTNGDALLPVYETDIRRTIRRVRGETSEIEVAFDRGFIIAGEQKQPVWEIELELKSGDPEALYQLGLAFAGTLDIRLGVLTKAERGALLHTGQAPEPVHAPAPLGGEPTVDETIGLLINACIGQFVANWPAFESGDGVVAIHQMRVAMRRLRSVLWLFQRSFPCAEFAAFRAQAKSLASALGEARNWDVFIALVRQGPFAAFPEEPGFQAILAACEQRRASEYESVGALLASSATTQFVLATQAFVARHGWRNAPSGTALPRLTEPARVFAAENLTWLHNKVLKRGKYLAELPPHERHILRIKLKKLRYVAELFGGLFEHRGQVRAYRRAMSKLQEQLGILNDLSTAYEMAAKLESGDAAAGRAIGIIIGWCGRAALADDKLLAKCWKAFREAKAFARAAQ